MNEREVFRNISDERMMTPDETYAYWQRQGAPVFLAFAQTREYPAHRFDALPARCADISDGSGFADDAAPGEAYAFQVIIYAGETLTNLCASGAECLNLRGVDCKGAPLIKRVNVPKGRVQALWFIERVPERFNGEKRIAVEVWADNAPRKRIEIALNVRGEPVAESGDLEPWRLSRLRWINSEYAIDDEPTQPFGPVALEGDRIRVLGRAIRLGGGALPASIISFFSQTNETIGTRETEVLASPITFEVETQKGGITLSGARWQLESASAGAVCLSAIHETDDITLSVSARAEFDGYFEYNIALTANKDTYINDARLCVPYKNAKYAMGLGKQGGLRREIIDFHFDERKNQDTLWMGEVNAGLMIRLKDERYQKPYMLIYYHDRPLKLPASWHNDGRGGARADASGAFVAYGGARAMRAGQTLNFAFDLCVTPVKPLARAHHFLDHYYHKLPASLADVARGGANIINLHHGNRLNPFINSPCFETRALRDYAEKCHDFGLRVKIYYTVKELTVHAPEFFPFLSMNGEILPAPTKPFKTWQGARQYADEWLERVIGGGFITAWRQKVNDGDYIDEMEASALVAPMSRFNNFFVENLRWLLEHTAIDGLYFDDTAFDRSVMKRVRKTLDRHHPGCALDLHSWNYYKDNTVDDSSLAGHGNSMNLYIDQAAFIDSIWFGEGFDYNCPPDVWLIEMSGIPFGLMGEMLQGDGDRYTGMLFGMTCRLPSKNNPTQIYELWRRFGIENASMRGFWTDDCPVRTSVEGVYATVFARADGALVALNNRSGRDISVKLDVDYATLGLNEPKCEWFAPAIGGFQNAFAANPDGVPLSNGGGCVLWVREKEDTLCAR